MRAIEKERQNRQKNVYILKNVTTVDLGCGEPLMGFCPYFRQENSSDGMSANFALIAGTLIVRFTLDFLQ
jgi:hypothetical protein